MISILERLILYFGQAIKSAHNTSRDYCILFRFQNKLLIIVSLVAIVLLFFGMFLMLAAEGRFSKPNENNQGNKCYCRN